MSDTTQAVPPIDCVAADGARDWRWTLLTALIAGGIAAVAFAIYFLPALLGRPLLDATEMRTAIVAREMAASKNYVVPTLGHENVLNLPPLPYWQTALSNALFFGGGTDDAQSMARATLFPSAMNAALTIFLVILFGSLFWGRSAGVAGGLMLATFYFFSNYAQNGNGDTALMLSSAATMTGVALLLSDSPGLGAALLAGFGLGFGLLTKGHVPLALIVLPCGVELVLRRRSIQWVNIVYIAMALVVAVLVATPLFVLVNRNAPEAFDTMLAEASSALFQPQTLSAQNAMASSLPAYRGVGFYFVRGAIGLLPWTPLLLAGFVFTRLKLKDSVPAPVEERQNARFFALYAALGFVLLLIAQKKADYYLMPLLPALALAAAGMFGRLKSPGGITEERMGWTQLALGVIGAVVLGCAPLIFSTLGIEIDRSFASKVIAFAPPPGMAAIVLAIGFFVVSFLCARLWTSGRGTVAVSILGVLMLGVFAYFPMRAAERTRNAARWSEFVDLKQQTDRVTAGSRLYSSGVNNQAMMFYTARIVRALNDLPTEPAAPGTQAYVIVYGNTAMLYDIPLPEIARATSEHFSLIELTPALEAQLRAAIQMRNSGAK